MADSPRLVSLDEAGRYLGLSARTIRRYIADGILTAHRIGPRVIRVDLRQVDRVLGLRS
jgi:excisionase family DNA binding protein